jgi:thiol-disulfide isomerase/thioredoxin
VIGVAAPAQGEAGGGASPAASTAPAPAAPELPVGWRWEIGPTALSEGLPVGISTAQMRGAFGFDEHARGVLLTAALTAQDPAGERVDRTVFVYDGAGERLRAEWLGGVGNDDVELQRLLFTREQAAAARWWGVGVLDAAGRCARAEAFARDAERDGANVMPAPEVGKPYVFDLPTIDGGRVRSADLKGKVVIVDFWATWCKPCMAELPQVQKLADLHAKDGLVVVGVTFDEDAAPAAQAMQDRGLAWPQVLAEHTNGKGERNYWHEVTGVTAIPRLFVIDRTGVLRDDDWSTHDVGLIERLLAEPAR